MTSDIAALTARSAEFSTKLLQCNEIPIKQLSCQIPAGFTTNRPIDNAPPVSIAIAHILPAEHCRYGTTDLSPTMDDNPSSRHVLGAHTKARLRCGC